MTKSLSIFTADGRVQDFVRVPEDSLAQVVDALKLAAPGWVRIDFEQGSRVIHINRVQVTKIVEM